MKFGELLREKREERGLSRQTLATASGLPFGTLHNYEIGRRAPSFGNVVKLAAALGLTCQDFAGCEDIADGETSPEPPAPEPPARKARDGKRKGGKGKKTS